MIEQQQLYSDLEEDLAIQRAIREERLKKLENEREAAITLHERNLNELQNLLDALLIGRDKFIERHTKLYAKELLSYKDGDKEIFKDIPHEKIYEIAQEAINFEINAKKYTHYSTDEKIEEIKRKIRSRDITEDLMSDEDLHHFVKNNVMENKGLKEIGRQGAFLNKKIRKIEKNQKNERKLIGKLKNNNFKQDKGVKQVLGWANKEKARMHIAEKKEEAAKQKILDLDLDILLLDAPANKRPKI